MSKMTQSRFAALCRKAALLLCIVAGVASLVPEAASAVDLPEGATLTPPSDWPMQPPANKGPVYIVSGKLIGVWGCVTFSQLPPGNDVICGYLDVFPQPPPPGPAPANSVWKCIKGVNIYIYSQPFNKGECAYFPIDSVPDGATSPTPMEKAVAKQDKYDYLTHMLEVPPINVMPTGTKPLAKEETIAQIDELSSKAKGQATAVGAAGSVCKSADTWWCHVLEFVVSGLYAFSWSAARNADMARATPGQTAVSLNSATLVVNYTEIAVPVIKSLPEQPITIDTMAEMTQELATALNVFLEHTEQLLAMEEAVFLSLERADAAALAGDWYWELRQMTTAQQYQRQAAVLAAGVPATLVALENALTAAGVSIEFSRQDVIDYQEDVRKNGLPSDTARMLTNLGADTAAQDLIRVDVLLVDSEQASLLGATNPISPGRFPQLLTDDKVVQTYSDLAQAFDEGFVYDGGWIYLPLAAR